jgi:hypothetical protein
MTSRDSVGGDERLRLFLALRLPGGWLDAIAAWQARAFQGRPVRVVPREHLHVTLVFLGSRPAGEAPAVVERLRDAAASAGPIRLHPERYRETRGAAMLTFRDEDGAGGALADEAGRDEARPWLPHVTVARYRERPRLEEEFPIRYEQMFWFRPTRLLICPGCARRARSTRYWHRPHSGHI